MRRLIALTPLVIACATAPAPQPVAKPEPPPEVPIAAGRPAPTPPWLFLDWGSMLVIAPDLDERWLSGTPRLYDEDGYRAERTLVDAPDLAPTRAFVGTEMKVACNDAAEHAIRVTGLAAMSWTDPEEDNLSELWSIRDGREPTDEERAAVIWKLGRHILTAKFEWIGESCDRPLIAAPAAVLPNVLVRDNYPEGTKPDKKLIARARDLVRKHSIWDEQEEAYQESLRLLKENRTLLANNDYEAVLSDPMPKHWDDPRKGDAEEYTRADLDSFRDADGKALYHLLHIGNDVACGAPRMWVLVDGDASEILSYGLDWGPEAVVDLERDGTWELYRSNYLASWVERLDPSAEVLRASGKATQTLMLDCGWEQVPPIATIQDLLKPKPPSPE